MGKTLRATTVLTAALTAGAAFAASPSGEPDLRIGIVSDPHVSISPGASADGTAELFRRALEWFREREVDGVLVCGDLTNTGLQDEFELMAATWNSVFPGGVGKNGRPVANLMHYGDHDAEARFYKPAELEPRYARAGLPVPPSLSEGDLRKTLWEQCFGEEWAPIQHKKVNGYDFFIAHYMRETPGTATGLVEILANAGLDPSRPFFYSQHRPVSGTYLADEEMWGGDSGLQMPVLLHYTNAVVFAGHTHYMLTDDRIVWQEAFTHINAGALQNAPCGRQRENGTDISWQPDDYMHDTQMPCLDIWQGHGAMLMSLYGAEVVLERRDIMRELPLGPDIVFSVSSEALAGKTFSTAARTARSVAPEFPAGAVATASRGTGQNRRGESTEQVTVSFPVVNPSGNNPRAFDYVVRAVASNGAVVKEKRVYSPGINLPPENDANEATCVFSVDELGSSAVGFTVSPANCWRVEGHHISCDVPAVEAPPGEDWSGDDLAIHGTTTPEATYVKRMNADSLSAANITLGTEEGSASIVAVDSTISASGEFCLGAEASPGYGNLAATVFLTNSTLSCSTLRLGSGVDKNANSPLSMDIGPASIVYCANVKRNCGRTPVINFTGGRMVFRADDDWWQSGRAYRSLVWVEENTWNGHWPNGGLVFRGIGAPIDIEVNKYRELACGWGSRSFMLSGDGGLVKRGSGTLIWEWRTSNNSGEFASIVDYTGDTVVKGGGIVLMNDQNVTKTYATPSASALKLESGTWFNLNGHPASFLGVSGAGTLKNTVIDTDTPTTPTTLTLGASGGDGEFSPATVIGSLDVVKLGTGTLTIGVSSLDGSLYASNGTVRVASGTSFRCNAIIADGAALDLRGAHVTCDTLTLANCATIIKDANTVIDCTVVVDNDTEWVGGRLSAFGDVSKTGSGTLTLYGPSAKAAGSVEIAEGTVVCKPASTFAGKYYRLQWYGDADKNPNGWESNPYYGVSFSEFSLYGVNGERANRGAYAYTELPVAATQTQGGDCGGIDDAAQLAECEVAVWMPHHDAYFTTNPKHTSPAVIFDGNVEDGLWNVFYRDRWNYLVFRIPNGSPDVAAFTFATDMIPSRRPTQWSLAGSTDGVNWTALANNATNTDDVVAWTFLTNSTPDTARTEYRLALLDRLPAGSANYAPFGGAEVSVASGATLDFDSAEMGISRLKVDMDAGGGTITRFTPVENGMVEIVSASSVAGDVVLPLTVSHLGSPQNLGTWTVRVNGSVNGGKRIQWRNGSLCVGALGTTFLVL